MGVSQKWKDTVDKAIADPTWDAYDTVIKNELAHYAAVFGQHSQFSVPTLKLIKAMLWTESGGPSNPSWKGRVMQIGNKGDPAYGVLKAGKEGSDLIMSASLRSDIKSDLINKPEVNIRAALAYLMTRMAKTDIKSVRDPSDKLVREHTVKSGDNYSKIATAVGTTVEELKTSNPSVKPSALKVGQKLKYHKANMKRVIVGWRKFTAESVSDRYNGGGDEFYTDKLKYILNNVIPKLKRPK